MRRIADLSHVIEHGMQTYPGLPVPVVGDHLGFEESRDHYDEGITFQIGRIEMVANTGTYLDVPAHRFPDGYGLAELPLERVVEVPVTVVDVETTAITAAELGAAELRGRAVLLRTGWSDRWGTPAYGEGGHPHLTVSAIERLVAAEPAVVGIDSLNIDDTEGGGRPAHTGLLEAGIPIIEHLTALDRLDSARDMRLTALPVAVRGLGSFPVRVVVVWDEREHGTAP
jgi:arylformamidase